MIASGGTGVYRFAISGALPAGIGLDTTTGAISGTPTVDGTFSYTVQVTDSAGAIATTGSTPCTLQLAGRAALHCRPAAAGFGCAGPRPGSQSPRGNHLGDQAAGRSRRRRSIRRRWRRRRAIRPSRQAALGTPQDDHPFILGAEDQITVLVYGSPEFSGQHMIRPDGKITMPFLGDVVATGITPAELSFSIKDKLKKYIVDPDVSVSVSAVNSKRYYIQGEVNRTGEYKLLVPTKVLEALVNAGGFKDFANQKKIVIMRVTGERLNFNYKEVIKGKNMDQNIYLKPGDIIIVH